MTRVRKDCVAFIFLGICLASCCGFSERDVRYRGPDEVWEGDPLSISCIVTIRDSQEWTLNNSLITADNYPGYTMSEKRLDTFREETTLQTDSAQLQHQGMYRCNRFSRDFHYLKVIPAFPDPSTEEETPTRKPTNEYILQINETFEFYCSSAKDDDVPVMWFKNGAQIKENSRPNILIAGLILVIQNAQEDDVGEYMCTVDTSKATGYTYIGRVFYLNSPPRIVDFPQKKSVIRGQNLILSCTAKGYPVPKFSWFIGNLNASQLKETDPRIFIHPDNLKKSVLVIERVTSSDRGLYTCRAENSVNSGQSVDYDEESVMVHVRENEIETNEDQPGIGKMLIPGEDLHLQCKMTECMHCVVDWFKDGERLHTIPNHIKIHEANNSITIKNASYSDSGEYICTVDFMQLDTTLSIPHHLQCKQETRELNGQNTPFGNSGLRVKNYFTCQAFNQVDASHTTVLIQVKNDMIKTNEDLPGVGKLLNPGDPLVLQCNTTDCSLCTVVWFKNGQPLHSKPGHLNIHDKNNSLIIKSSSYNDSGVYVCAIDRKHLDVALNASILVQSKIKLDKFDNSAVVTEGSPLELFCNAKSAPTPLIKWFINNQEIFEDDKRIKLLEHEGLKKGKLLIEEADFSDRNHYTCEAYNQVDAVNSTVFIRVKGKLAALWPFLGICVEVVILGTIIFICERKKSINQCDETDSALPAENKNRDQKGRGQDVRQRK